MAGEIGSRKGVALHVRWFDALDYQWHHNAPTQYCGRALFLIEERINSACYFVFSDNPENACKKIALPEGRVEAVERNQGDEKVYAYL